MTVSLRYLRQMGLVDQPRLGRLRVLVRGSADGVADLVVLLIQLGLGQQGGKIGLALEGPDVPRSVFWNLAYPEHSSLESLVNAQPSLFHLNREGEAESGWDFHLSLNGTEDVDLPAIYGSVWGPRAILSAVPVRFPAHFETSTLHPLSPAFRVACASAMIERMLAELNLRKAVTVSDAWLTVTCRIETTDLAEASKLVKSTTGMPIIMTPTSDGLATLARVRLPHPLPFNPFEHLEVEVVKAEALPETLDLGLVGWDAGPHMLDEPFTISNQKMVMLGVGGLGSWAAPLLVEQMAQGELHIVDGDASIELHNLNRQVLYNDNHLGSPKAEVAGQRLSDLSPGVQIFPYNEYLFPSHVEASLPKIDDEEDDLMSFDLNAGMEESLLPLVLPEASVFFGCLDNMRARTLLNEAALHHDAVMINGGSESVHAIVERFSAQEGCMTCRYGREVAYEEEIISCTEEGARPVASIATTTAWSGAMMAVFGLLEGAKFSTQVPLPRFQWYKGAVDRMWVQSKPPWMDEACICHI